MRIRQGRGVNKMVQIMKNKLKQSIEKISGITLVSLDEDKDCFKVIVRFYSSSEVKSVKFFLDYLVEIKIPKKYPKKLPTCKEYGDREIIKYHHLNGDDTFCIGTEFELHYRLAPNYKIETYVELIAEYLTVYEYFKRYNTMPVTERSHGKNGILEGYKHLLSVETMEALVSLVASIPVNNKMRNKNCPCGSGKSFKNCHLKQLSKITNTPQLKRQVTLDFSMYLPD